MEQAVTLFDRTVEIDLPEGYEPVSARPNDTTHPTPPPFIAALIAELQKSFTDEDRSDMLQSRIHELFRRDHNAYVAASLTGQDWDTAKLNERLDEYYQSIARSPPLVANAEIATREANSIDEGDKTTSGKSIGLIRYTFATPRHDWFANTLLLPAGDQEAVINMVCDAEQLPARAFEFMSIADSVKVAGTVTSDVQTTGSNL